jgi:transcriptional regulator with XRE-family HTH domain
MNLDKLDKERQILNSLHGKEYREALAIEHVNTTLAIQIRKMRENHQWKQSDLAARLDKHQETVSQWENPDYGRHSMTTLKALAAAFDVALLVKFIPFSELVQDMVNLSETRLSPPSFGEEQYYASALVAVTSNPMEGIKVVDANAPIFVSSYNPSNILDRANVGKELVHA